MKFGNLIKCSLRKFLFKKLCTKCGAETSPRHIFKKSKLGIALDQRSEFSYSLLLLYAQVVDYQDMLKLRCSLHAFTSYKAFFKKQKDVWN